MDLIILLIFMAGVIYFFKNFKSFVYFLACTEILFHILTYIKDNINVIEISNLIDKYIPTSILSIVSKYTNGVFYDILSWLFIICFIIFLVLVIKSLFKSKKK